MSIKDKLDNIEKGLNICDKIEIEVQKLFTHIKSKSYRVNLKNMSKYEKETIMMVIEKSIN